MMMKKTIVLLLIAVLCCAGMALAEGGLRLTYGLLDGELTLAPAEYQGEEALYVEFHSRDMDYTYLAPHLRYNDFEMLVR